MCEEEVDEDWVRSEDKVEGEPQFFVCEDCDCGVTLEGDQWVNKPNYNGWADNYYFCECDNSAFIKCTADNAHKHRPITEGNKQSVCRECGWSA